MANEKITLNGVSKEDLELTGSLSETGMNSTEVADAIFKAHSIQSSASEIDGSVNRKEKLSLGESFFNIEDNKSLFDLSRWVVTNNGSGTPIRENSNDYLKFSNLGLKLGNSTNGSQTTKTDMYTILPYEYNLSDIDGVTAWIYVPSQHVADARYSSDYGEMRIYFTNDTGTIGLGAKFISLGVSLQVGWNNVYLPKSWFNIPIGTGELDWATIKRIRIQFNTGVGNIGTPIYIDSIFAGGGKPKKTPIVVTLDDSTVDTYYMANTMNQYGIKVSSFIIPSLIDIEVATGYLRVHHIRDMYNRGNHIGIHDTGINAFAEFPERILAVRDWLIDKGFTRNNEHLYGTYPNGAYSQATIDLLQSNGFKGFRQVSQRFRDDATFMEETKGKSHLEPIINGGIADVLKISGNRPTNYTEFVTRIDEAISTGSAYLPYFHLFTEVGGRNEWILMAKYLKQKVDEGLIECLTFPEFVQKYS